MFEINYSENTARNEPVSLMLWYVGEGLPAANE